MKDTQARTLDGSLIYYTKEQLNLIREQKKIQAKWARAQKKCEDLRKLEEAAFEKYSPNLKKKFEMSPLVNIGIMGDFMPDGVSDTEIHLVDSVGQMLDFRVGPAFGKNGIYKEPALWIGYQTRYLSSRRQGDLLISPKLWRRLNKELELRFNKFSSRNYGPSSRKVVSATAEYQKLAKQLKKIQKKAKKEKK